MTHLQVNDDGSWQIVRVDTTIESLSESDGGHGKCSTCGNWVGLLNKHAKGLLIRSTRTLIVHEQPFCSVECRDLYPWATDKDLFAIETPATLSWYLCHHCQPVGPSSVLVGVGEVVFRVEGDDLLTCNQDGVELARTGILDVECERCVHQHVLCPAPEFFYAEPGDLGWRRVWEAYREGSHGFDRDIRVSVYELNFADVLLRWRADGDLELDPNVVVEQWKFENPKQVNAWCRQRRTTSMQATIRANHIALKQTA